MADSSAAAERDPGRAGSGRPRRRLKPEQRCAEILDATMTLLAEKGYWGLTLADVAKDLQVTVQAILHYFPSKNALLLAVLARRDEVDIDNAAPPGRQLRSAAEYVEVVTCLMQRNSLRPELIRLYSVLSAESLNPSHPAHDFFVERLERSVATLAELAQGWHPNPRQLGLQTVSFLDGLQLNWLRDPRIDLVEQWRIWAADVLDPNASFSSRRDSPAGERGHPSPTSKGRRSE
jgi:AcrR family transcriptional regulator